jgi:hypothetical protein
MPEDHGGATWDGKFPERAVFGLGRLWARARRPELESPIGVRAGQDQQRTTDSGHRAQDGEAHVRAELEPDKPPVCLINLLSDPVGPYCVLNY